MRRLVGLILGGAALLLLAAGAAKAADASVSIQGCTTAAKFIPDLVVIEAGENVQWTNLHQPNPTCDAGHTATDRDNEWDTGNIPPGASKTLKFEEAGTYDYYCKWHPNMVATVVVNPSSADPPTVSIASPADGAVVPQGSVTVSGTASESAQFVWVVVDDGQRRDAAGTTEWTWTWDTSGLEPGSTHTLQGVASDGTREGTSETIEVTIEVPNEPPTVSIAAPAAGATVSGTITVQGTASDPESALSKVEVRFDGGDWTDATGAAAWSLPLDTRPLANGPHTVEARATDAEGAVAEAGPVEFTVENEVGDDAPPTVSIAFPTEGATLSGVVTVRGSASDDLGVDDVSVRVDDGEWSLADGTTSWTFTIDTLDLTDGAHVLHARARDATGHANETNVTVLVSKPKVTSELTLDVEPDTVVRGVVNVTGIAKDVIAVEVSVDDGSWVVADVEDGVWAFEWDTRGLAEGAHTLRVRASDGDRLLEGGPVTVLVDNVPADEEARGEPPSNLPPRITHFEPARGVSVSGAIRFLVVAADPEGGRVQSTLRVDGTRLAGGDESLDYTWPAFEARLGERSVVAEACDAEALCASEAWSFTIVSSSTKARDDPDEALVPEDVLEEDSTEAQTEPEAPRGAARREIPAAGAFAAVAVAAGLLRRR